MFRKMGSIAAIAGSITMCSWGLGSDASAAPPEVASGQARYKPIQGMTYEFGSKLMTGYFVKQSTACVVTLMITDSDATDESDLVIPLQQMTCASLKFLDVFRQAALEGMRRIRLVP